MTWLELRSHAYYVALTRGPPRWARAGASALPEPAQQFPSEVSAQKEGRRVTFHDRPLSGPSALCSNGGFGVSSPHHWLNSTKCLGPNIWGALDMWRLLRDGQAAAGEPQRRPGSGSARGTAGVDGRSPLVRAVCAGRGGARACGCAPFASRSGGVQGKKAPGHFPGLSIGP